MAFVYDNVNKQQLRKLLRRPQEDTQRSATLKCNESIFFNIIRVLPVCRASHISKY